MTCVPFRNRSRAPHYFNPLPLLPPCKRAASVCRHSTSLFQPFGVWQSGKLPLRCYPLLCLPISASDRPFVILRGGLRACWKVPPHTLTQLPLCEASARSSSPRYVLVFVFRSHLDTPAMQPRRGHIAHRPGGRGSCAFSIALFPASPHLPFCWPSFHAPRSVNRRRAVRSGRHLPIWLTPLSPK